MNGTPFLTLTVCSSSLDGNEKGMNLWQRRVLLPWHLWCRVAARRPPPPPRWRNLEEGAKRRDAYIKVTSGQYKWECSWNSGSSMVKLKQNLCWKQLHLGNLWHLFTSVLLSSCAGLLQRLKKEPILRWLMKCYISQKCQDLHLFDLHKLAMCN